LEASTRPGGQEHSYSTAAFFTAPKRCAAMVRHASMFGAVPIASIFVEKYWKSRAAGNLYTVKAHTYHSQLPQLAS
jgi:hypothetical protein